MTFVMTDVVGSTALWEQAPDEMRSALALHDALLAGEATRTGGRVVKSRGEGDSAFVVFDDPARALAFAAAVTRGLARQAWPTPRPISVRIAVHRGWAADRDDYLVGPAVNRCARLRALAHGGQILVSDGVRAAVDGRPGGDMWLLDLGRHRLRDVVEPEHVWQLCHADLAREFPALGSENLTPTNLPVPLTSFLGREAELETLARAEARLVTVHGAGGLGKTRLALEYASRHLAEHPDGVWLVPLDAVGDEEGVAPAIVAAMGLRAERGGSERAIEEYLAARRALLVLDNAEHVLGLASGIAVRLLEACAHLRILVTSREALDVPGESVLTLRPFDLPQGDDIEAASAVHLFVARARLRDHTFALSASNRQAVARICRLVDGIPLAIELAAARVGAFDIPTIAELLQDRARILTDGPRTVPDRQRSMRGAIDWSVALLDDEQRDTFEQLSVFAGSFTLEAARAVVGAGAPMHVPALVERSMLVAEPAEDGMRYRSLEPIRAYAVELLGARGDAADVRSAALAWATSWIDRGDRTPDIPACAQEWPNVRALLAHDPRPGDEQHALVVAAGMAPFFQTHGLVDEGLRLIGAALDRASEDVEPAIVARAQARRGGLALMNGALDEAEEAYLAGMRAADAGADEHEIAASLSGLAEIARARGQYDAAEARYAEAIRRLRAAGDPVPLAQALGNQANLFHAQRRFAEARVSLEEALVVAPELHPATVLTLSMRLAQVERAEGRWEDARDRLEMCLRVARERDDRRAEGAGHSMLGATLLELGDVETAIRQLEEGLRIRREIGDVAGIAASTYALGDALTVAGDLARAGELLAESRRRWEQMRAPLGEAAVLHAEALLARARGDLPAAEDAARAALELFRTLGDREGIAVCLSTLGGVTIASGDATAGVEMLSASEEVSRALGSPRSRAAADRWDADVAAGRRALGEQAFDDAWARGAAEVLDGLIPRA